MKKHNNVSLNTIKNYMSHLIIKTAVGSSNIMPKPNLKTHVQAPKYKVKGKNTLNSVFVFHVSNSEVN